MKLLNPCPLDFTVCKNGKWKPCFHSPNSAMGSVRESEPAHHVAHTFTLGSKLHHTFIFIYLCEYFYSASQNNHSSPTPKIVQTTCRLQPKMRNTRILFVTLTHYLPKETSKQTNILTQKHKHKQRSAYTHPRQVPYE